MRVRDVMGASTPAQQRLIRSQATLLHCIIHVAINGRIIYSLGKRVTQQDLQ
ncbi:MAG: hypothetical protein MI924_20750 [Chloroflexales bacterium]|nr:hypothetical protein [Chloroflexales bacterium]